MRAAKLRLGTPSLRRSLHPVRAHDAKHATYTAEAYTLTCAARRPPPPTPPPRAWPVAPSPRRRAGGSAGPGRRPACPPPMLVRPGRAAARWNGGAPPAAHEKVRGSADARRRTIRRRQTPLRAAGESVSLLDADRELIWNRDCKTSIKNVNNPLPESS